MVSCSDYCRVHPDIQNVLEQCPLDPSPVEGPTTLIDPLKLIIAQDGDYREYVAAVQENEKHEFELMNVFRNQRAKGIPQFKIMLPEK